MRNRRTIYGKWPIEPNELARLINQKRWRRPRFPNCPGTQELFECLHAIGGSLPQDLKSKVVTANGIGKIGTFFNDKKKRGRRAFLLDFLWWREGYGTMLAAESELSAGDEKSLIHDFEKLLCWKSPLKLMIVRESPALTAEKIRKILGDYARKWVPQLVKNECYILFVFGTRTGRNSAYSFISPKDRARSFRFTQIELSESVKG